MDDLFYFTKSQIHLHDVEKSAAEAGYECKFISSARMVWLNIDDRDRDVWQWSELRESDGDLEEDGTFSVIYTLENIGQLPRPFIEDEGSC